MPETFQVPDKTAAIKKQLTIVCLKCMYAHGEADSVEILVEDTEDGAVVNCKWASPYLESGHYTDNGKDTIEALEKLSAQLNEVIAARINRGKHTPEIIAGDLSSLNGYLKYLKFEFSGTKYSVKAFLPGSWM